ncbi:MAG: succinate dehydrogenase cytochrome b subunit [Verrucomicrobiota bacterium]
MNILQILFQTSLGKKYVMAVTGLILVGFIIGHLVGNLQIFFPPDNINAYAHFLQGLGGALWLVRFALLAALILHVYVSIRLVLENKAARGGSGYADQKTLKASYASRTMKYSGPIVFFFILYHLLHFTVRGDFLGATVPETTLADGTPVHDIHSMMVIAFQDVWVSLAYIFSIGLLSVHLSHGLSSMFQSLGLRTRTWSSVLQKAAVVVSVLYFLGNLAIPAAVMAGAVKVQNPDAIVASACAACDACPIAKGLVVVSEEANP